jgi:hemophore-related protein
MAFFGKACAALVLAGGVALGGAPLASADPEPPHCTAADLAGIMSGVTASTSVYLHTHPDVNYFLSDLKKLPKEERKAKVKEFFTAHPQEADELRGLRQPVRDFHARCGGPEHHHDR